MFENLPNAKRQYEFGCGHTVSDPKWRMVNRKKYKSCSICRNVELVSCYFYCVNPLCGKKVYFPPTSFAGRVKYCPECSILSKQESTNASQLRYAEKNRKRKALYQKKYIESGMTKKDFAALKSERKSDCRFLWIKCFPECVKKNIVLNCAGCRHYWPILEKTDFITKMPDEIKDNYAYIRI